MRGNEQSPYLPVASPTGSGSDSFGRRLLARKKPLIIAAVLIGGVIFSATWNPPTGSVHNFTEASDFNARRESGCTNSGDGCHGSDSGYRDFNAYHPETECKVCHEYTGVGCIPCHGPSQHDCTGCHDGSMEGASDCVRLTDSYPRGHYRESLHTAMGTETSQTVLAVKGGTAKATCGDCHSRDLREAHTGVPEVEGSSYGTDIGCAECHNDTQSGALKQVRSDWEQHRCEDCHGEKARSPMHATDVATAIEAESEDGCGATGAGCHDINDLHAVHPDNPVNCSGAAAEGEPICHDLTVQASKPTAKACGAGEGTCHAPYENDALAHKHDDEMHLAANQGLILLVDKLTGTGITCSACHSMDIVAEHDRSNVPLSGNRCQACHNVRDEVTSVVKDSWPDRLGLDACNPCHAPAHAQMDDVHTATQLADDGTVSTSACVRSGCHATTDVRAVHASVGCTISGCHSKSGPIRGTRMACGGDGSDSAVACHTTNRHAGAHDALEAGISGTRSSACTSCHGRSIFNVSAGAHSGCTCHTKGEATAANNECADCHEGSRAPHGFVDGTATGEGWVAASGHNTTTFGVIGALEKFDGSKGVTLHWEAEQYFASMPASWEVEAGFQWAEAPTGYAGTEVEIGDTGIVTTTWEFPEANVFWSAEATAAPAGAIKGLKADSVITCQDCHTGLLLAGPHGADDHWGLDPAFPADYSLGELTKRIDSYPSGMRLRSSLVNETQTYADGDALICAKCHDLQNYQSGTTKNNPLPVWSSGDVAFEHDGDTWDPIYIDAVSSRSRGYYVWTRNDGTQVDPASIMITGIGGGAHDQAWSSTDVEAQAWIQGDAGVFTSATVGSSNTAHSSHHQDTNDGSAQCVNCHIGVPHGWKRPRLLVNSGWNGAASDIGAGVVVGDPAPYRDPDLLGTSRTNGGIPMNPVTGYNGMGMLTLSAVDNHFLWAGSSSATDPAKQYYTGAAYWSEPSCQACNDHAGEDGIRIVNEE